MKRVVVLVFVIVTALVGTWAMRVTRRSGMPMASIVNAQEPSAPAGAEGDPDADPTEADPMSDHPFARRLPAPSLEGGVGWINTSGPLDLKDLRGKFVLLDFWTYCCINCMHILPELKKLERAYPTEIVVIGVHSAKFDTEQDTKNITEAVLRYDIEHPVINDSNHAVWNKFEVMSWPTLWVIDPEGNLVARHSGEITFEELDRFFQTSLPYYRQRGLLDATPLRFDLEKYRADTTPLRFPGKVMADEAGGRLFITDTNHHRLIITDLNGKLLETIGSGALGAGDGGFAEATFNQPQGVALRGDALYVADTENHLLRLADLKSRTVRTVAGTGTQSRNPWPGYDPAGKPGDAAGHFVGPPRETALTSPWSLHLHGDDLYIAMAGSHQIWKMPLDESEIGPYAGNGREDIVDGRLLPDEPYAPGSASFAQPSELSGDEHWLYVADSEGSSIRAVPFDPAGEVRTVVGTAHLQGARLFTFGDVDGGGTKARLQHALGVVVHRGRLYVADTYNNKIKQVDPESGETVSLCGTGEAGLNDDPPQFDEPGGISAAHDKVFVADTNNHRIRVIDLAHNHRVSTLEIAGLTAPAAPPLAAPVEDTLASETISVEKTVRPAEGALGFDVELVLPTGWKINPLAPMAYQVEAGAPTGPVDRAALGTSTRVDPPAAQFPIRLPVIAPTGEDRLRVHLRYYYCQESAAGLCKMGQVTWDVSLRLLADEGESSVALRLDVK